MKRLVGRLFVHSFLVLFVVFAMGVLVLGSNASAECPDGSYKRSCKSDKTTCDGETLSSECKRMNGTWKTTSLQGYKSCTQDIANCDGTLKCLCGTDCPSGSYSRSCFCCTTKEIANMQTGVFETELNCKCKDKKGKYQDTTLSNTGRCSKDIENMNGVLTCKTN
mgnify:CR=1 FL=1